MRIQLQVFILTFWCVSLLSLGFVLADEEQSTSTNVFAKENLVAWCIVPFDGMERGPEERAAMLARLGIRKLAYDYRAKHVPTFDAEMVALKKHKIELTAWWFPGSMNAEARNILAVLKRHDVKTQLWVSGGGGPKSPNEQASWVKKEAARIRPIAEAAKEIGCRVGLYNHGGWFGEPENQIAIIRQLRLPNVGIVYNLHHGIAGIADFLQKTRIDYLRVDGVDDENIETLINGLKKSGTRDLGIEGKTLTLAGVRKLAELPNLGVLTIGGLKLSRDDIAGLRKQMPKTSIRNARVR